MSHQEIHQIQDARDMFLLDCEARRLTPATRDFYRRKLRLFIRWLEEQNTRELQELTAHQIRQFLVSIHQRDLSA